MAILKNNKKIMQQETVKKEINPPTMPLVDVRKRCFFCNQEATFIGAFKNQWFDLAVLMCDNHLKRIIDRNVELEKLEYELPTFSDESDEELGEE